MSAVPWANCRREGRSVSRASGEDLIALPVEGLDDQRLREFSMLCSSEMPRLIVTQQRARAIGIETSTPMALSLPRAADASGVLELAAGNKSHFIAEAEAADYAATAAIRLVKLVRGLPAILAARTTAIDNDVIQSISVIDADAVHRFVDGRNEQAGRSQRGDHSAGIGNISTFCRVSGRARRRPGCYHRRQTRRIRNPCRFGFTRPV